MNQNFVPFLYSDSIYKPISTSILRSYANWLLINKPKPTPCLLIIELSLFYNLPNALNSFGKSYALIPIPVSITEISILFIDKKIILKVIDPSIVNLKALLIKLIMIYFILF